MYFLQVEGYFIFLSHAQNDFSLMQFLSQKPQLVIKLVLFRFKKIINIIQNDNYGFVFDLADLYLTVIIKFSYFVKLVPENVFVLYPIKVYVEVYLEYLSLNEVSNTFKSKGSAANPDFAVDYIHDLV